MRQYRILSLVSFICLTNCISVPKKAKTVSGEAVHEPGKSRERCVDWLTQGELTATKWTLLLDELDAEPEAIRKQTITRLMVQLDQWSDEQRTIPHHWRPMDIQRRKAVFQLIRHLDPKPLNHTWHKFSLTQPMPHISTISIRNAHHALEIAKHPKHFPRLKHLNIYLHGQPLKQSLSALLRSPVAKQLITLNLRGHGITNETLKTLVNNANNLTNLKHLHLRGDDRANKTRNDTSAFDQLVATKFFNTLHSLSIERTRDTLDPLLKAIERGKPLKNLHTLSLHRNEVSSQHVQLLTKSQKWIALKHLDLSGNQLKPDDFKAISQSNILQGLQSLNLRLTNLDDQGASWLGYSDVLKEVRHLDLSRTLITDDGIWRLFGHHRLKNLRTLNLQANRLTAKSARHLAQAKYLEKLEALDMRWLSIGDEGLITLSTIPMSLHTLRLARNNITAHGVKAMIRAPWATSLKVLDLDDNHIKDDGAIALATLKTFLRVLRLRANSIEDRGLQALLKSDMVRLVEVLILNNNKWTHQGATAFGKAKTMERLITLELRHTRLGTPENLERMANSPSTLHLHRVRMTMANIDVGEQKEMTPTDHPTGKKKRQLSIGIQQLGHIQVLGEKVIKSPYLSAAIRRAIDAKIQKSIHFLENDPHTQKKTPRTVLVIALNYLKRLDTLNREKLPSHALPPKTTTYTPR